MQRKRKTYSSEEELARDRQRMWDEGWVITGRRDVPVPRWRWFPSGASENALVWLIMSPLILLGWVIWRHAPEREIVVEYERE